MDIANINHIIVKVIELYLFIGIVFFWLVHGNFDYVAVKWKTGWGRVSTFLLFALIAVTCWAWFIVDGLIDRFRKE